MAQVLKNSPDAFIAKFSPLNQVASKYHSQLASHLRLVKVKAGAGIIQQDKNSKLLHFLVRGKVEIRESFDIRYPIDHNDQDADLSLESRLQNRSSVKAVSDCIILVANNDKVDQLLTWGQDYTIFYLDEGDVSLKDDDLIDDDFQEDWDNVFIRSNLAANLSNIVIHQLMSQLENVEVKARQVIVKAHSPGDYFYVIKQGRAEVQTDSNGPFRGECFTLGAGSYFGDEALVAETTRNATVTMDSDGILGRLNIDAFNHLIKQHLVSPLTNDIDTLGKNVKILDVRFPIEYRQGHEPGSVNMPISFLRKQLQNMKPSQVYVITPANDRRAELATYLMRQAGFQAYQLGAPETKPLNTAAKPARVEAVPA